MKLMKDSFVELSARDRAKVVLDAGTFREILGPFDRLESPHLVLQDIVPASDDGIIIGRGLLDGQPAVVISMEGAFQGGGIGEVAGAKFAGALELALRDHEKGIPTRPIILFDSGGVRLQEANYGLLAISEIQSVIVALRHYIPVIGVIPGKIGCFGGMSMTAGLLSTLIMTREGRLTLNGPEVIEQEAGVLEFDSKNKELIWKTTGGAQRCGTGLADILVDDDVNEIVDAIKTTFKCENILEPRSRQIELYLSRLKSIDPSRALDPMRLREMWGQDQILVKEERKSITIGAEVESQPQDVISRGMTWFKKLTGISNPKVGDVPSVLCADAVLGEEQVRYIAVVPNPTNRFPRVRRGEVGLEEGWTIAKFIREAIEEDADKGKRRPIIAIVDVPSQAYGYKEELLGIFQSCAAAVDAYASARLAGHPVISLVVGNAISGAFLAHGYQANRIIALDDPGVLVHAMSKQSAARVTKRSIAELEEAAKKVPSIAYDIRSYSTLGTLHELVNGIHADGPQSHDIESIMLKLMDAVESARTAPRDLSNRLISKEALMGRAASIKVREELVKQWN